MEGVSSKAQKPQTADRLKLYDQHIFQNTSLTVPSLGQTDGPADNRVQNLALLLLLCIPQKKTMCIISTLKHKACTPEASQSESTNEGISSKSDKTNKKGIKHEKLEPSHSTE